MDSLSSMVDGESGGDERNDQRKMTFIYKYGMHVVQPVPAKSRQKHIRSSMGGWGGREMYGALWWYKWETQRKKVRRGPVILYMVVQVEDAIGGQEGGRKVIRRRLITFMCDHHERKE
jgi:hypothetical protein